MADLVASRFSVHPSTAIGIAAFAIVYAWRVRQTTTTDVGPTPPQRMAFFTALALLFLTLNGPLHDLSDFYLFSAHMVQHLVLTLVVPPLMIVGTPGWMLRPLLTSRRAPWIGAVARRVTTTAASSPTTGFGRPACACFDGSGSRRRPRSSRSRSCCRWWC